MNRTEIIHQIEMLLNQNKFEEVVLYCNDIVGFPFRYFLGGILFKKWQLCRSEEMLKVYDSYSFLNLEYFWHYNFLSIQQYHDKLISDNNKEVYLASILVYAAPPYYDSFLPYYKFDSIYRQLKDLNSTTFSVSEYERLHLNSDEEKEIQDQILIPDVTSRIDDLINGRDYNELEKFVSNLPNDYSILCLFLIYKHFILSPCQPIADLLIKFSDSYPEMEYQSEFNLFRIQLLIEILEFNPIDYKSMETLLQIYLEDQEKYKEFVPVDELLEKLKLGNPNSKILESFKY